MKIVTGRRTIEITRRKALLVVALILAPVLLGAGSCSTGPEQNTPQGNPQQAENYKAQVSNAPAPALSDSLERRNVGEHLERNNRPKRIQYIYLLADTGGVYAFFPIRGKVSAAGSQLSPSDTVIDGCSGSEYCPQVVQGPSDDGSFGSDEGGIFFFTQDGVEIQWNGRWLLADAPLSLQSPTVTLVLPRGSKPAAK